MLRFTRRFAATTFVTVAAQCDQARALISGGHPEEALKVLDHVKALGAHPPDVECDLLRAQAFLTLGRGLDARQALLEELRLNPGNEFAFQLLNNCRQHFESMLRLPAPLVKQEPLFAMCYEGIVESTMLSWPRLLSLFRAARALAEDDVEGDVVECGVAGGGSAVLVALAFAHYDAPHRRRNVYVCDTFAGMPTPVEADKLAQASAVPAAESHWATGTCTGPVKTVLDLATRFDVSLTPVVGRFDATLGSLPAPSVALFHCDCDWYESTKTALTQVVPKMTNPRAMLQVDDYHYWAGCKRATDEYFAATSQRRAPRWEAVDGNAVIGKIGTQATV